MTAPTLTEFLLARIAEEKTAARKVEDDPGDVQRTYYDRLGVATADGKFDQVWLTIDPARVLAECAAKRGIVKEWGRAERLGTNGFGPGVLRHLASVYADHPDCREEWGPVNPSTARHLLATLGAVVAVALGGVMIAYADDSPEAPCEAPVGRAIQSDAP